MNGIGGLGGSGSLPQQVGGVVGESALPRRAAGLGAGDLQRFGAITNAQGQTLFDIRGELHAAVRDAMAGAEAGETNPDRAARIQQAIHSTLVEHGFDPAVLEAARTGQGLGPAPVAGGNAASGSLGLAQFAGDSTSLDDALFGEGDESEDGGATDFLQLLLGEFRAGVNLDLEI
ncbi:MAG: hypothetical protein NXI31_06190 [bacterium]|nr:hypothetical protein [bacterium]